MTPIDLDAWSKTPFADADEIARAMTDLRYRDVHASGYRRAVQAKLALGAVEEITTSLPVTGTGEHFHADPVAHLDPATGLPDPDRMAEVEAQQEELRRQMVETFGPDSMPGGDPFGAPLSYEDAVKELREKYGDSAVNPNG